MLNDSEIIRMIFGFKVRYHRQLANLSFQELSKKTGLSMSYLNEIEKGKKYPKPVKITALAQAFDVDYNYLVSTNASKKLQPIIDLLTSRFFRYFPLEEFGIDPEKLLELFIIKPNKVNAFVSTIFNLGRQFRIDEERFFKVALRSYQDMNENYFEDIEEAVRELKKSQKISFPHSLEQLEASLKDIFGITVDRESLGQKENLKDIRSYFLPNEQKLLINTKLDHEQEKFLIAREMGFQWLKLKERPLETRIIKIDSFEKLLNNFRASYFAVAFLLDEEEMVKDIRSLLRANEWNPELPLNILDKYEVTQEMFIQRMMNLLPKHFGFQDLFFIRMSDRGNFSHFRMTKELHLSQIHSPYHNELNEHYCHRWVSVNILKNLRTELSTGKQVKGRAEAQISHYYKSDKSYLCISLAKPSNKSRNENVSVTIGMAVTQHLQASVKFLDDPNIVTKDVHTTCERCSLTDCYARVAPPIHIEQDLVKDALEKELQSLVKKAVPQNTN